MSNYYLTVEDVIGLNDYQIERFGGASGVRDGGLVKAAVERPQSGYYSDIIEEAAAFWESLTMNHGFVDGNKRIGFVATMVFLRMNNLKIDVAEEVPAQFILKNIEAGTFYKDNLDAWLREHVQKA